MSKQVSHQVESPSARPKLICGTFFPNGTSTTPMTVAAGTLVGKGIANVTRTGNAGEFTVTLEECFAQKLAHDATVQMNAFTNLDAQIGAFSNVGTGTPVSFIVRTHATGTGTDMASNANNSVSFWVLFNDSGVQ